MGASSNMVCRCEILRRLVNTSRIENVNMKHSKLKPTELVFLTPPFHKNLVYVMVGYGYIYRGFSQPCLIILKSHPNSPWVDPQNSPWIQTDIPWKKHRCAGAFWTQPRSRPPRRSHTLSAWPCGQLNGENADGRPRLWWEKVEFTMNFIKNDIK